MDQVVGLITKMAMASCIQNVSIHLLCLIDI